MIEELEKKLNKPFNPKDVQKAYESLVEYCHRHNIQTDPFQIVIEYLTY